jgi:hypothetical protein
MRLILPKPRYTLVSTLTALGEKARVTRRAAKVKVMAQTDYRLGDLIDDYCLRCKLLLNHAVASMMNGQVVKVICQTCFTEHAYRHGVGGKKEKLANPRATLFDQVLAKTAPVAEASTPAPAPPVKKRTAAPARYISHRHKTRPPRSSR